MQLFASIATLLLPLLPAAPESASSNTQPVLTTDAQDPKPKPAQEGDKPKPAQEGQKPDDKPKGDGDKDADKDQHDDGHATWGHDYKDALAAAKKAKKPVLMLFTGSDWCPPCKKLHADVFESEAFQKWADKNVVLLELDFPRRKELPKEQKEHNDKLQKEFKVSGFPTVVFLDSKGSKLFDQVGFGGGNAEDWIKKVDKQLKKK